jgi:hypothetical protein
MKNSPRLTSRHTPLSSSVFWGAGIIAVATLVYAVVHNTEELPPPSQHPYGVHHSLLKCRHPSEFQKVFDEEFV